MGVALNNATPVRSMAGQLNNGAPSSPVTNSSTGDGAIDGGDPALLFASLARRA